MILDVSPEMLESLGYRVYTAGSGQEALAVYTEKQGEIDLVVLDMIMLKGLSRRVREVLDNLGALSIRIH